MSVSARWFVVSLVAIHLVVAVGWDWPRMIRGPEVNVDTLSALVHDTKPDGIEEQVRRMCERDVRRREVLAELRSRRIGLLAAAARFRDLDLAAPDGVRNLRRAFADGSDEERYCRQVIAWVRVWSLDASWPGTPALVEELETELAESLRRDGSVRLPPMNG